MEKLTASECADRFISEWNGRSPAVSAHTSGSTGTPKEILLSKEMMRRSAMRTISFFDITARSRLHSCVSPAFIGGKMMVLRAILSGARFSIEEPSNNALASVEGECIDLVSVVPSQLAGILERGRPYPQVARYLCGGSAIDPSLRESIVDAGLEVWESYGMTETASHIALRRVERSPGPFYPLEGITVALDSRGCLEIRENGNLPDAIDVTTNDLATLTADGGFRIDGRFDHMILTGGKKVLPEEVENRLRPTLAEAGLGSDDFFVTSRPDRRWTQAVVLVIAGAPELAARLEKMIADLPENIIPRWQRPKAVIPLPQLRHTPSGKLIRRL